MALFTIPNVKLSGIAAAVPTAVQDNLQCNLLSEREREMFVKTVGIRYRRVAPKAITAADLCFEAAQKLLSHLQWNAVDISALVMVTQTPDYVIPNTASVLQHRLGLGKNCLAFDVNLGCSGYVYGLSIIGSMLQNMPGGKALLLVGDVSTHVISDKDKSTWPLFSDAGSASALEYSLNNDMHFHLQNDGSEFDDIIVPDGGFRNPINKQSFTVNEFEPGICRSNADMKLDGLKIFNFALREVAPNIQALFNAHQKTVDDVEYAVFHQANLLMLESVRKKLNAPKEKVPYSLHDFGNTSSATIPVTMVTQLRNQLQSQSLNLLLSGFGVGLSWGSVLLKTENIICSELIEVS